MVQMMDFVALVKNVSHHFWWRCVHNGRGDDVRHVSMILVFGNPQFRVRVELSDSGKVHVASDSR